MRFSDVPENDACSGTLDTRSGTTNYSRHPPGDLKPASSSYSKRFQRTACSRYPSQGSSSNSFRWSIRQNVPGQSHGTCMCQYVVAPTKQGSDVPGFYCYGPTT